MYMMLSLVDNATFSIIAMVIHMGAAITEPTELTCCLNHKVFRLCTHLLYSEVFNGSDDDVSIQSLGRTKPSQRADMGDSSHMT